MTFRCCRMCAISHQKVTLAEGVCCMFAQSINQTSTNLQMNTKLCATEPLNFFSSRMVTSVFTLKSNMASTSAESVKRQRTAQSGDDTTVAAIGGGAGGGAGAGAAVAAAMAKPAAGSAAALAPIRYSTVPAITLGLLVMDRKRGGFDPEWGLEVWYIHHCVCVWFHEGTRGVVSSRLCAPTHVCALRC